MISVTYRNNHWEVPGNITVHDLLISIGVNPESVLALKDGKLITEKTTLGKEAEIKVIGVISGG
jgi:sulfur carrier protein ThiS